MLQALRGAGTLPVSTVATLGWSQSYPGKAVRWIVPLPPGGSTDLMSRLIAQRLSDMWRSQVIVVNQPDVQDRFSAEGGVIVAGTPEAFGAYVRAESARWTKVIHETGVRAE